MPTTTYDFNNGIRSVQTVFDTLIQDYPTLLKMIAKGANATSTKEEWLNDTLAPQSTAITSFVTDGDGTQINVTSTAGMAVNQLLRFTSAAGADRAEIVKVTAIDSATRFTCSRDFGGSTGVTLVSGDLVFNMSKPVVQGSTASAQSAAEPSVDYNYTQIFEGSVSLARTALQTQQYGGANNMAYQINRILTEKLFEVNSALIYGRRYVGTASAPATLGGLLQFLESGNIDTTGSAISKTIINNMLAACYADGAVASKYVIVCAPNQARKISAFNTAGSNPLTMVSPDSTVTGGYISKFVGDLPVMSGFTADILVEPIFPKDKIMLLDLNSVELAYLQGFGTTDATANGQDGTTQRVLGELTLRVKNGTKAHALATGLTI